MKDKLDAYAMRRDEGVSLIIREALIKFLNDESSPGASLAEPLAPYGSLVSPETLVEDAKRNLRSSSSMKPNSPSDKKASA